MADDLAANFTGEWFKDYLGQYAADHIRKTPFDVIIYPDLLSEDHFNALRSDVKQCLSCQLQFKDNDLYKFHQTADIKSEIASIDLKPMVGLFIDLMLDQVRLKLESLTGLKLSPKNFDITASRYGKGEYLLCHNDHCKFISNHRRALAFVYYMNTRQWTREDGGALILYDSDASGEPISINNTIEPRPNTLVVFRTTPTSWHSVEEVFCDNDERLSLNGWFHIQDNHVNNDITLIEPCPYNFIRPVPLEDRVEKFFKECVSGEYLMGKTCYLIRRKFKSKSEINLTSFLIKEKFDEISKGLLEASKNGDNMQHVGPYNKRKYRTLELAKLPLICQDLHAAFQSELFFMLLARLTGLDLEPPSLHQEDVDAKQSCGNANEEVDDDDDDDEDDDDSEDDDYEDSDDEDDVDNLNDGSSSEDDTNINVKEIMEQTKNVTEHGGSMNDENILEQVVKATSSKKTSPDEQEQHTNDSSEALSSKEATSISSSKNAPPKKRKRKSDPLARLEYRHLESGDYTLLHDHSYEQGEKSALDVILHFNHDFDVNFDAGGYIHYMDTTGDDEDGCDLLSIEPKSNCLSLVYREGGDNTCRFLKYMTKAHKASYQDLHCVYYEKPDDLPHSSDAKQEQVK